MTQAKLMDCYGRQPRTRSKTEFATVRRPARANENRVDLKAMPVWAAALLARECEAITDSGRHTIAWRLAGTSALHTNTGITLERIEPFGVTLESGQTLIVSWAPGDSGYTLRIVRQ